MNDYNNDNDEMKKPYVNILPHKQIHYLYTCVYNDKFVLPINAFRKCFSHQKSLSFLFYLLFSLKTM